MKAHLAALLFLIISFQTARSQSDYLDESDPMQLVLGNAYYRIGVDKSAGFITFIVDASLGDTLVVGQRFDNLWEATFATTEAPLLNAHEYAGKPGRGFSYDWDENSKRLSLQYTSDPDSGLALIATIYLTLSDLPYFDLDANVKNEYGSAMRTFTFPGYLRIKSGIREALVPEQLVLKSGFFDQGRSRSFDYPSGPAFANICSFEVGNSSISIYSHQDEYTVVPRTIALEPDLEFSTEYLYGNTYMPIWLEQGSSWSVPRMRVRIRQSYWEVIQAYREENGLDAFPSVREKLGSRLGRVPFLPLLYFDPNILNMNFKEIASTLEKLPGPGILMLSNNWGGPFDGAHPDYIPPDPRWGTEEDLKDLFRRAKELGFLMAPFTLPVWWHENSPTMKNLPGGLTVRDVSIIDENNEPWYQYWALGERRDWGYFVSPFSPFVQQRLQELMEQFTLEYPGDLIVEDVLGAQRLSLDFNANCPNPMAYNGWILHTKKYKDLGLLTENGYDLLAETELGFYGSILNAWHPRDLLDEWLGVGNWKFYPLASALVHDKVLFYQYWSDPTVVAATLTWNLAFGFMLNYFAIPPEGCGNCLENLYGPWPAALMVFQERVASRYAGERLTAFEDLSEDVTRSTFETVTVTSNWSRTSAYEHNGQVIIPEGAVLESTSGDLTAGIFSSFNGRVLSPGDHYLIVKRIGDTTRVWQPIGDETSITIMRRENWGDATRISVLGVGMNATHGTHATVSEDDVTFQWTRLVEGDSIRYYDVVYRPSSVRIESPTASFTYALQQNYPNPLTRRATISFTLPVFTHVKLELFDVLGRKVASLLDDDKPAGQHAISLFVGDLTSGTYFYRFTAGGYSETRRLTVTR